METDLFLHSNWNLLELDSYLISHKETGQKSLESRSFKTCSAQLRYKNRLTSVMKSQLAWRTETKLHSDFVIGTSFIGWNNRANFNGPNNIFTAIPSPPSGNSTGLSSVCRCSEITRGILLFYFYSNSEIYTKTSVRYNFECSEEFIVLETWDWFQLHLWEYKTLTRC